MRKLVWTKPALESLDSIYEYISRDSEYYASNVIDEIIKSAEQTIDFPEMGRVVPEFGDNMVREMLVRNYRVVYRVQSDRNEILTVIHGRRLLTMDYIS